MWLKMAMIIFKSGISYFMVSAIEMQLFLFLLQKAVDETFVKGELLAEIEGADGSTKLYAPWCRSGYGINPMIENPYDMQPNQVWVYKCHLKKRSIRNLMSEQEYAQAIQ